MKITKYEHACLTIEIDGEIIIIDPGIFAKSLPALNNIAAIIITHEHEDHFDPELISQIQERNPDALVISVDSVVEKIKDHGRSPAHSGEVFEFGPFKIDIFGDKHAEVHRSIPLVDNIGILVNDIFYYPGDSFTTPDRPVELLALPTSGPWLKVGEVIDFVLKINPKKAFPTHDIHNSEEAKKLLKWIVGGKADAAGTEYVSLGIGESIEV